MEERSNNKNKDFEDLLRSMETRKTADLDDFEREALEGFASLESEEEAKKIKSSLDEKIYKELFSEEKKKRPFAYWFAAAGLLLVIGLSVLFVTDTENITGKKDVAQTITPEETPAKEQPVISTPETAPPAENLKKTDTRKENNKAKDRMNGSGEIPNDGLVKNTANETYRSNSNDNLAPAEDANAEKPVIADVKKEKEKAEVTLINDEEKITAPAYIENSVSTTVAREETKESKQKYKQSSGKKSAAPSSADKTAMPYSAAGNVAQNTGPAPKTEGKATTKSDGDDLKLAEKDRKDNGEDYCYYAGGKEALKTELKKKLAEQNTDKAFEATLFISEKKEVEKVIFINSGTLTSKERKKIISALKELRGFNFFIQPTQKGLHEYKLNYTP